MISTYGVPGVHDAQAGAVLLVLAVHHHPVAGVAVHAVLHRRVQVLVSLPDNWVNIFFTKNILNERMNRIHVNTSV